jgi:lipopolysaccharide export system permease protein
VGPLTFSLTALTSLLLLNYVAKQFGNLVGKGLPADVIGSFVLFSIPFTLAMTLPMSVLIATLYAFSRLAAENEITALKANGVSMVRLFIPVLISAAVLSVGMIAFNDLVLPVANHRLRTLQGDIARKKPTFGLRERVINEVSPGRFFLQANHLDPFTNQMRDITIYDLSDPMRRRTIYADSGEVAFQANGSDLLLTLRRGSMLEVPKAEPMRLQRLHFERDFVRVEGVANQLEMTREDSYKSDREMSVCELQNEVSRYEHEYSASREELRRVLGAAAREALTGLPAQPVEPYQSTVISTMPGSSAPRSEYFSVGRLYCDGKLWLRKRGIRIALARSLFAATPEAVGEGNASIAGHIAGAVQDTGRRADSARAAAADSARRVADSAALALQDSARRLADSLTRAVQDSLRRADSAAGRTDPMAGAVPAAVAPPVYPTASSLPYMIAGQVTAARARMVENRRQINQNAVELHKKFAISVACFVFVLIGAPMALRFPRAGVGLVIGVSLGVFGLYYVGLIGGEALADRNLLTPFWAMWAANILLTGVGLIMLARMGRESATARGGDVAELLDLVRGVFRRGDGSGRRGRPGPRGSGAGSKDLDRAPPLERAPGIAGPA